MVARAGLPIASLLWELIHILYQTLGDSNFYAYIGDGGVLETVVDSILCSLETLWYRVHSSIFLFCVCAAIRCDAKDHYEHAPCVVFISG